MATAKPDKHRLLRGFAPASRRAQGATPDHRVEGNGRARNVYRHDYEDVAAQHVWDAVQIDLPPLRTVIDQELAAVDLPPGE